MTETLVAPPANGNISVMECGLVWEFLLLTRRQESELTAYAKAVRCSDLQRVVKERRALSAAQATVLELLLLGAQLPLPQKAPALEGNSLCFHELLICSAIFAITQRRIAALTYIMRSLLTGNSLRLLAGEWLAGEADMLGKTVAAVCEVS